MYRALNTLTAFASGTLNFSPLAFHSLGEVAELRPRVLEFLGVWRHDRTLLSSLSPATAPTTTRDHDPGGRLTR